MKEMRHLPLSPWARTFTLIAKYWSAPGTDARVISQSNINKLRALLEVKLKGQIKPFANPNVHYGWRAAKVATLHTALFSSSSFSTYIGCTSYHFLFYSRAFPCAASCRTQTHLETSTTMALARDQLARNMYVRVIFIVSERFHCPKTKW